MAVPNAIARKSPSSELQWPWRWILPATRTYRVASGASNRHHFHESKRVIRHALRHTFATHLLEAGYDIRTSAPP